MKNKSITGGEVDRAALKREATRGYIEHSCGNCDQCSYEAVSWTIDHLASTGRIMGEWRPISEAPKDGTSVLLKLKDDLSDFGMRDPEYWNGLQFVGRSATGDHDLCGWSFAAPVGHGGFPDKWMDGWMPLPAAPGERG